VSEKGNLLCIGGDPDQSESRKLLLESNGYKVTTTCTDQDGLNLLNSRGIDAVVAEVTGDSWFAATEWKKVHPQVPIVVVANSLDLPCFALDSVDAFVASFDGPQFLLDTLHFLLQVKPTQRSEKPPQNTQALRHHFAESTASAWRTSVME
jgi:DNA-binding NtrC family response regulator